MEIADFNLERVVDQVIGWAELCVTGDPLRWCLVEDGRVIAETPHVPIWFFDYIDRFPAVDPDCLLTPRGDLERVAPVNWATWEESDRFYCVAGEDDEPYYVEAVTATRELAAFFHSILHAEQPDPPIHDRADLLVPGPEGLRYRGALKRWDAFDDSMLAEERIWWGKDTLSKTPHRGHSKARLRWGVFPDTGEARLPEGSDTPGALHLSEPSSRA